MEDTLRAYDLRSCPYSSLCLNPCFNGRYSQSALGNDGLSACKKS